MVRFHRRSVASNPSRRGAGGTMPTPAAVASGPRAAAGPALPGLEAALDAGRRPAIPEREPGVPADDPVPSDGDRDPRPRAEDALEPPEPHRPSARGRAQLASPASQPRGPPSAAPGARPASIAAPDHDPRAAGGPHVETLDARVAALREVARDPHAHALKDAERHRLPRLAHGEL